MSVTSDTFQILKVIISEVIAEYPERSLWYMMAHAQSSVPLRKQRYEAIIELVTKIKPSLRKSIAEYSL